MVHHVVPCAHAGTILSLTDAEALPCGPGSAGQLAVPYFPEPHDCVAGYFQLLTSCGPASWLLLLIYL